MVKDVVVSVGGFADLFDLIKDKELSYIDAVVWLACVANMQEDRYVEVRQTDVAIAIGASKGRVSEAFKSLVGFGFLEKKSLGGFKYKVPGQLAQQVD